MSVSLKQSYDIEYDGTANVARMDLFVDTAADLAGLTTFDSITLLQGSTAEDISTGDKYMMQTNGTWVKQPSQSAFANVYTKAEIDSLLYLYYTKTEADSLFEWITVTITTDTLPLSFIADGSSLTAWTISGNGQQTGTPTPDNPVMPDFVGTLDGADWSIPISCGGQTVPVYLGQTQTVRKIKKLVLTGTENWQRASGTMYLSELAFDYKRAQSSSTYICSHYGTTPQVNSAGSVSDGTMSMAYDTNNQRLYIRDTAFSSAADFKTFLATKYANGTPVTVWYVLANEQTGIINEPLCKIGDYCDELSITDTAVTIPTVKGANTLTVETDLQPSEMTIAGKIRR